MCHNTIQSNMRLGMVTRGICINNEAACGPMSVWSPPILMTPDSMWVRVVMGVSSRA